MGNLSLAITVGDGWLVVLTFGHGDPRKVKTSLLRVLEAVTVQPSLVNTLLQYSGRFDAEK